MGAPIVLPERSGVFVFGRSSKATLVFDDVGISAKHCEVKFSEGFWVVRDLGSAGGTRVNGVAINYPYSLSDGDVIEFGITRLRFHVDVPEEPRELIETLAADLNDERRWAVYADWLAELGDPLAERIVARTESRLDDRRFLGPLWPFVLQGSLELQWRKGHIMAATVRRVSEPAGGEFRWQPVLHGLLENRVSRLMQSLRVDLVRLEGDGALEAVETLLQMLVRRRRLPALNTLQVGTWFDGARPAVMPPEALMARLPRLSGALVGTARESRLVLLETRGRMLVNGMSQGEGALQVKALSQLARFRLNAKEHTLFVEEPPNLQLMRDGNPAFMSRDRNGWTLRAGNLGRTLTVNGVHHPTLELMSGDVIEVADTAKFKFEVAV